MIGEADYRSVNSAVRTPRLAVLIDERSPHWRTAIASLVRSFSQTWGGKHFLIVPTDGKRIKDKFWELLEAYSPDYLGTYASTLADIEEADPDVYKAAVDNLRQGWKFDSSFDEWFEKQKYASRIGEFSIDPALDTELRNRLSPIMATDKAARHSLIRGHGLGFPFTNVHDINPNANQPVRRVVLPKRTANLDLRNLVLSQSGDLDKEASDEYAAQGVAVETLPDDYRTEDMVTALLQGSVDTADIRLKKALAEQLPPDQSAPWTPDEDYVGQMPFQASMLHLARYYLLSTHRDWEEPVTVVIGDAVDDFCLYYCLARLHDGAYWLPKAWLDDSDRRRRNNIRLHRNGRPTRDYSETASVANAILRTIYKAVGYGQDGKRINLLSASLGQDELRRELRTLDRIHWGIAGNLSRHADIKPLESSSTNCVARIIEQNNYTNQQDMVFIGGRSVGRIATPKPKNFSVVDPSNHRWMTSFDISQYSPPPLPGLGAQIAPTHESRVAIDGIVYMCPGIAYFGGDIDVALTRPQLALVSAQEILRQYFAEAGLEVKPSDKGNYLSDTISRFGDLATAASFIRSGESRAILDLFMTEKSTDDGRVVHLQAESRAFVNYDGVHQCVGSNATGVVDHLVGKDILRRGLVFLCLRCRLASWYDVAELTSEFTCHRCSLKQQFTKANWKSPDEPRWYYSLAETVYQCYTHNSYLTILVLDHLRQRAKTSFQYLPEIDVLNFPKPGEIHEIDVACLVDNRIFVGECKTEALKPTHTKKYETLATMLPRRPDGIVFATTHQAVSSAFQQAAAGIAGSLVLTGSELLS
jgi:hypothetical protein